MHEMNDAFFLANAVISEVWVGHHFSITGRDFLKAIYPLSPASFSYCQGGLRQKAVVAGFQSMHRMTDIISNNDVCRLEATFTAIRLSYQTLRREGLILVKSLSKRKTDA